MLIVFQSKAAADVLMFSKHALPYPPHQGGRTPGERTTPGQFPRPR